ncbi:ShlB/FhaC/HecB family hemolysin secretion/activation protein [Pseudoalteromonas fenneropenaei]|uniref:ShlB/FhaC/HecB family hemolysin secretion/activation protein n=1 Tax=Pseudoalteromonas fenneropenaei TaxID=1737459 RepID=A0ABV7CLL3_9GAMM
MIFQLSAQTLPSTASCGNQHHLEQDRVPLSRQLNDETALPEANGATIHVINLQQLNVFNTDLPEEDNALFRFANRAHIQTKPEVIRSILLFQEGDVYEPKLLRESERLLRQQAYLYDARLYANVACNGDIHVTVVTRDLWTLLPDLGFRRSGGDNASRIGFRESNLFGYGKRLSLTYTKDVDRSGYTFIYEDPNILSSRYTGRLQYADNDDGELHYASIAYPFFATDTPYSYGALSYSNRRTESQYERGEIINEFEQKSTVQQIFFGYADKLSHNWTRRTLFGLQHEEESFYALPTTTLPIATERSLLYPYVQWQWFEDNFTKVRNFDSIFRTEDLNLGWSLDAKLGYSDNHWQDDDSKATFAISASRAMYLDERSLLRFALNSQGQYLTEQSAWQNLISSATVQYYLNTSYRDTWYASLSLQTASELTADKQLTLGGETGLRGYPTKYQQGDSLFLVNLEKRYYWEYDLWQLFKVGGAAFFDIGRVSGRPLFNQDHRVLKNLGVGLRLAPSRANANLMLHFDVAVPLDKADDVDSVQWLFTVKERF